MELAAQGSDLTVAAQAGNVEERALAVHARGLHGMPKSLPVHVAQIMRHDEIEFLADGIGCRMAKQRDCAGAPELNDPAGVGNDDCMLFHVTSRQAAPP